MKMSQEPLKAERQESATRARRSKFALLEQESRKNPVQMRAARGLAAKWRGRTSGMSEEFFIARPARRKTVGWLSAALVCAFGAVFQLPSAAVCRWDLKISTPGQDTRVQVGSGSVFGNIFTVKQGSGFLLTGGVSWVRYPRVKSYSCEV